MHQHVHRDQVLNLLVRLPPFFFFFFKALLVRETGAGLLTRS